ncbi:MAG: alpha/beta fold hydrolase [Balneolaceae bacterium]|nr:alpha/beta fold hydrolase [Balneolaceae bacterium]
MAVRRAETPDPFAGGTEPNQPVPGVQLTCPPCSRELKPAIRLNYNRNTPILGVQHKPDRFLTTDLNHIPEFRPAPWCFNGHVHTIGRSLLTRAGDPYHKRIEIATPDGDFLDLDIIKAPSRRPVVVLFHGLEGSSKRYYMTELATALAGQQYTVIGVNFRGCSGRMNRKPRFYHSGETEDLDTVFRWVRERFPNSPIGAAGFSLGGNALLKSLGERQGDHPLKAAATVSVPYDLALGARHISEGFNRIYEYNFIRTMKQKLKEKRQQFPDLPEFRGQTLYAFDDQVTAPVHGFRDADHYYETCSSQRFLQHIRTPTLLVHSRQDPICPPDMIPVEKIDANASLSRLITGQGGHVGFWSRPSGWINRTLVNFFAKKFDVEASETEVTTNKKNKNIPQQW